MSSLYIRWFSELGLADAAAVGGKCAGLGELMRAGIRVPPGFALTTAAYEQFLDEGALPPDVLEELQAAYVQLGRAGGDADVPVAVRSSAIGEDSAEASFAGQQDTYLWQRGVDNVARAVVRCWASLYTPQAVAYRARLGPHAARPMTGVAVQRMVDARVAGVLFTLSPATGDRSMIAINASWGLGIGVVGGEVTPDAYWVDKVHMVVRRRTIGHKAIAHRPDTAVGCGTRVEDVRVDLQDAACLSDQEAVELARLGKAVERHFGCAQDVEWAIATDNPADGQGKGFPESVYLLQSRPETVWSRRPPTPLVQPAASAVDYVLRALRGGSATDT